MTKITTKQHILAYMRGRGEVSGTELESQAQEWYTKSSVISRRCRELAADGYLTRSIGFSGAVQYSLPVKKQTWSDAKAISWR